MEETTNYLYCPETGRRIHKSVCAKQFCEWVLVNAETGAISCRNISEVPTKKTMRKNGRSKK